jgi:hypothetical protein
MTSHDSFETGAKVLAGGHGGLRGCGHCGQWTRPAGAQDVWSVAGETETACRANCLRPEGERGSGIEREAQEL